MNEIDEKKDVFISYAHEDKTSEQWLIELINFLEENKISYHIDKQWSDDDWMKKIDESFENSQKVLCLVTLAWMEKEGTTYERKKAKIKDPNGENKYVIPIKLESCEDDWLEFCNAIDFTQTSLRDEKWDELLWRIRPELRGSHLIKFTMPAPDDDVSPTAQVSVLAIPLDKDVMVPAMPFNLSTIWGLERNSFIGIVTGRKDDGLYESLKRAEATLNTVDRATGQPTKFKTRWWIRVDFKQYPDGPIDECQIWDAAQEAKNTRQVRYLRRKKLVDELIPGFFFESPYDAMEDTSPIIKRWCDSIFNSIFPLRTPALIVHITGETKDDYLNCIRRLAKTLSDISPVSPQSMKIPNWSLQETKRRNKSTFDAPPPSPLNILKNRRKVPGLHFISWVYHAMCTQKGREELLPFEDGGKKYPHVFEVIDQFWEKCSQHLEKTQSDERPEIIGTRVVFDIDEYLHERSALFHREMFLLTNEYLPEHIPELVRAYAGSNTKEARMEALFFSLPFDPLVDIWIEGNGFKEGKVPHLDDFAKAPVMPTREPPLTTYITGLLRALKRGDLGAKARDELSLLRNQVVGPLANVCDFYLKKSDGGQDIKAWGANECLYSLRAGETNRLREAWISSRGLDQAHIWWALSALPPGRNLFSAVHSMEPEKRAIFGLCNPDEFQTILLDPHLWHKINECRRNRPIHRKVCRTQGGDDVND